MKFQGLLNRIKNAVQSQHSTDYLADCNQCGFKPKRMWSHTGTMLVCDCNIITSRNGGSWGTLEHSWQILQGASTELDELRANLAEECHLHNMYRANIWACLEKIKTDGFAISDIDEMLKITCKRDQQSVS